MRTRVNLLLVLALSAVACFRLTGMGDAQLGPPETIGADATGPLQVVAQGQHQGMAWRYSVYPSNDGWCTQLETGSGASVGCGADPPGDDAAISMIGWGMDGALTTLDAVVVPEAAQVVVRSADGRSIQADLFPVALDGADFQVALVFTQQAELESITVLDADGEVLERQDLR